MPCARDRIARAPMRRTERLPLPISLPAYFANLLAWFQRDWGRKAFGIALALLLEGVLLLALLSMAWLSPSPEKPRVAMTTITVSNDQDESAQDAPEPTPDKAQPKQVRPSPPQPSTTPTPQRTASPPAAPVTPVTSPPAFIPLTRDQMAAADISRLPAKPGPPGNDAPIGPAYTGRSNDTPLMGARGPRGEKLYAASWYREPYDDEMRGYLSTAQGPGWGLIACRTVADFRVEDCAVIDESPKGSNIARAAVAAAWQFRVRPPRLGGKVMVGEWVGIRIDYSR